MGELGHYSNVARRDRQPREHRPPLGILRVDRDRDDDVVVTCEILFDLIALHTYVAPAAALLAATILPAYAMILAARLLIAGGVGLSWARLVPGAFRVSLKQCV